MWRDWLIRALDENQRFDQFVIDQLAGDLRPNATLYQQIATGFCRNHRINSEAGSLAERATKPGNTSRPEFCPVT